MDKPKVTPKDFFLWAGAMLALWSGVVAFISLVFDYINYAFPDALTTYYIDPYQSGISYEMASLIVLAPVFFILMRVIRRDIERDPTRNDIWVRRWGLFLTLFAAGATIVVDLIVLINTFLSGEELSMRFLLKVLVVLLVAGAGFMHFLADLWGYWKQNPAYVRWINWATALLVVLTIVAGFFIVGTPGQARLARFDTQKVNDLQMIQSQAVYYWQQKGALPKSLSDLTDQISGFSAPKDPQSGQAYEYKATGPLSFELCADFNAPSTNANSRATAPEPASYLGPSGKMDNWAHAAGRQCFTRTIDPQLYPPAPTVKR